MEAATLRRLGPSVLEGLKPGALESSAINEVPPLKLVSIDDADWHGLRACALFNVEVAVEALAAELLLQLSPAAPSSRAKSF